MFSQSVSRTARRAAATAAAKSWTASQLLPAFLLPFRANLHSSSQATQFQSTSPEIPPQASSPSILKTTTTTPGAVTSSSSSSSSTTATTISAFTTSQPTTSITTSSQTTPPTPNTPLTLDSELASLLPNLQSQSPHYIAAHIHARPYLVTAGDTLRLPFLMPKVQPGQILRLNRASVLGSRDFTMKGAPYLDERLFECRARVVGVEAEPMRIKEKTKRRQRHVKTVRSKHRYTVLRIMEVKVKGLEELVSEGAKLEG